MRAVRLLSRSDIQSVIKLTANENKPPAKKPSPNILKLPPAAVKIMSSIAFPPEI